MPYGSGPLIRQALIHASPWQRFLIGVAMVAGGAVLVLLGHVAGTLLAVAGVFLIGTMVRSRLRRGHKKAEAAPGAGNL
jgi:hypothetical protein